MTIPLARLICALAVTTILAACGGGGGGSGSAGVGNGSGTVGSGAVGIVLTDKPANLSDIEKVLITITAVEIFADDDQGKVALYSGPPRGPFNLLKLQHESRPLAFRPDVPAGTYCKIRLTLSDLKLVFNNGEPDFRPKLPGNNKLDLNPRQCFDVAPGTTVYLQLDMDAKSIHVVQSGNGKKYNFRPVVFIDVIRRDSQSKLVRLEDGVIRRISAGDGKMLVCEFSYGQGTKGDVDDCVTVMISRDTSVFDNIDDDGINDVSGGTAIPLRELLLPERIGQSPVTIVGRLSLQEHDDQDGLLLDALVVELGGFLSLDGSVATGASDIRFNMNVDPNQGIQPNGELPVALQPAPDGGNGTKILSRSGDVLSGADITPPRQIMVDGVLILASPDYLNASLVILDTSDDGAKDEASGLIERLGTGSLQLAADTFPCEPGTGSFIVGFDSDTVVYLSAESGGRFVDTGSLAPGQKVDISGACGGTILAARTIIIRVD